MYWIVSSICVLWIFNLYSEKQIQNIVKLSWEKLWSCSRYQAEGTEIFDIDMVQNHFPTYWTINYESTQIFNFIDVSTLVQKCPWIPNDSDEKNENSNFSTTWCFLYMKFNCLKYYQTRLHKSQVLLNNRMTWENERMNPVGAHDHVAVGRMTQSSSNNRQRYTGFTVLFD